MDDFDEIEAALKRLSDDEGNLKKAANTIIEAVERARQARDRTFIVKSIVALYAAVIVILMLYLAVRGLYLKEDAFDDLAEIVKIAVLPIVTLVIGYYFAKLQ
jgi:membrane-anchored glycerophosphoryl diester phosphodiesterase (GDPDase)